MPSPPYYCTFERKNANGRIGIASKIMCMEMESTTPNGPRDEEDGHGAHANTIEYGYNGFDHWSNEEIGGMAGLSQRVTPIEPIPKSGQKASQIA